MKTALITTAAAFTLGAFTQAAPVTTPFLETFDDNTTSVDLSYDDFGAQSSGPSPVNGVEPGFTIAGGALTFFNNTDFGDIGAAVVQPTIDPATMAFSVSTNVAVDEVFFSSFDLGVVAFADNPTIFDTNLSGLFARVARDNGSETSRLVINNGSAELASISILDIDETTVSSFDISLDGIIDANGDVNLTATFDDGVSLPVTINALVASADVPAGADFGIRVQPFFNGLEVRFDDLAVTAVIPEPTSLAAIGLLGALGMRRRR